MSAPSPARGIDPTEDVSPSASLRAVWIRTREWRVAYFLVAPAFAALLCLRVIPAVVALWESFHRRSLFDPDTSVFAGWDNYVFLFTKSPTFLVSIRVTILFVVVTVAAQTVAALALAMLFTQRGWGASVWRTLVFLPITIPTAVSALVWGTAFRGDGPINGLLQRLGLAPQPFLGSTSQALWSIVVMASWIGVGYWMMFLIAGLKDIPSEIKEAAELDGAGPITMFFSIILPLLRRPLAFVVVANTVANFLQFVPAAILTQGGPQNSTRFVMYEIYTQAYVEGDVSLADTEIVIVLAVLLAIVAVQFRLLRARD